MCFYKDTYVGNYEYWTIFDEKLYMFYGPVSKQKFTAEVALTNYELISAGIERWDGWFGNTTIFSTNCYVDNITKKKSILPFH